MEKIQVEQMEEVIYQDITDEGLHIYMLVNKKARNFYMTLNVKYGSIDTEYKHKGQKSFNRVPNGIAHFLEHVMFYQPDGKTAHEYFSKLGSIVNACTTNEFTFYEVFGSSSFNKNLKYLLDFVYTPYFTKDNIKAEKSIITEEIKMYNDNPNFNMIMKLHECLWYKNKRKYLISGTVDDIKKISPENLYDVYNSFYHPSNMFLIITGNFNVYEASAIVKEYLKNQDFSEYELPLIKRQKEPNKVVSRYYEEKTNVFIPKVRIGIKIPLSTFKEYNHEELRLYLSVFLKVHFGITSTLHEQLFNNHLISKPISYAINIYESHFVLTITAQSKYPDEIVKIINNSFDNINISNKDIARCQKCLKSSFITSFDDIEDINSLIQDDIVFENKVINDRLNIIDSINIIDLNNIIKKLNISNKTVVVYKNEK